MPREKLETQPGRPRGTAGVRSGVLVLAGVAAALALGVGLGRWSGAGGSGAAPGAADPEAGLREELAQAREAREDLEERIQELELRLAQLELGGPFAAGPGRPSGPSARAEAEEPSDEEPGEALPGAGPAAPDRPWFDEQALVASGLDPQEASHLKALWEDMQLGKLYLADRAVREGWGRSLNRRVQEQSIERALRRDVGDESYDWILYATGQPNRVLVRNVLESSPAADSGLQPGDVILSYAGERVFRPRELKQATTEGVAGESVRVELMREGQPMSLYVPRGPLGALLRTERVAPREG